MAKEFGKISELDPRTVMIVDSLNLGFRWKHSGDTEFLEAYMKTVESLKKSYKAGKVIMACDSGSSQYRKSIYPEYKQNRKDKYEQQTEQERIQFELFFKEFNNTMENFVEFTNYPVFRFDKTEADDIAAYIVKNKKKYEIDKIILVSSDKDWDLLIDLDVMRFSYVTRKEITLENWHEHYDCDPEQYISIKCLTGDSGDNVPGVAGVGPKKAQALVDEYGSTIEIAASIPILSKYKYIHNLNQFGADALLTNYKLMDLLEFCEDALGKQNCETIDKTLEKYLNGTTN